LTELLTLHTGVFQSKGELRRLVEGGGLNINKKKITNIDDKIGSNDLLNNKYLLVQKGKKSYNLIIIK
jgi:tyrosyl-tRNA synthetase